MLDQEESEFAKTNIMCYIIFSGHTKGIETLHSNNCKTNICVRLSSCYGIPEKNPIKRQKDLLWLSVSDFTSQSVDSVGRWPPGEQHIVAVTQRTFLHNDNLSAKEEGLESHNPSAVCSSDPALFKQAVYSQDYITSQLHHRIPGNNASTSGLWQTLQTEIEWYSGAHCTVSVFIALLKTKMMLQDVYIV